MAHTHVPSRIKKVEAEGIERSENREDDSQDVTKSAETRDLPLPVTRTREDSPQQSVTERVRHENRPFVSIPRNALAVLASVSMMTAKLQLRCAPSDWQYLLPMAGNRRTP